MCSAPFKNDVLFPGPFILASWNNDMMPEGSECFVPFFVFCFINDSHWCLGVCHSADSEGRWKWSSMRPISTKSHICKIVGICTIIYNYIYHNYIYIYTYIYDYFMIYDRSMGITYMSRFKKKKKSSLEKKSLFEQESCTILCSSTFFGVADTPSCQWGNSLNALRQNTCQVCSSHTLLTSRYGSVCESTTLQERGDLPLS